MAGDIATDGRAIDRRPELGSNELFDVLGNQRRRYALHYLLNKSGDSVDLKEVSSQVAAWELGEDPAELSYDDRKSVHTAMHQYHAPKLDEIGLIEYDAQRRVVRVTERAQDLNIYVEAVRGRETPWPTYFLWLSGLSALVVIAALLDVPVVGMVPDIGWLLCLLGLFVTSSVGFTYDYYDRMRLGGAGPPPDIRES
jgi:hypothetical protein